MGNPEAIPSSVVPDIASVTILLNFFEVHVKVRVNGLAEPEEIWLELVSLSCEAVFTSTPKIAALVLQTRPEEEAQGTAAAICSPDTTIL